MNTPSVVASSAATASPALAGPVAAGAGPEVGLEAAVLAELVSIALEGAPLGLVLEHIARIAAGAIPGACAVSVTLVREQRAATSAGFTGALAAVLDERQYDSGFGPCLHAAATMSEVVVADTSAEATYPAFAAVAARHGVGSMVAVGLAVAGPATAALNVYRAEAGGDGAAMAATVHAARVFGAYAAVAVSNAAALDAQRTTSAQLSAALVSRAGIEQAKGMLMAQRGIGAEAAFALLSAASQATNVKLREVAARVITTSAGQGTPRP